MKNHSAECEYTYSHSALWKNSSKIFFVMNEESKFQDDKNQLSVEVEALLDILADIYFTDVLKEPLENEQHNIPKKKGKKKHVEREKGQSEA